MGRSRVLPRLVSHFRQGCRVPRSDKISTCQSRNVRHCNAKTPHGRGGKGAPQWKGKFPKSISACVVAVVAALRVTDFKFGHDSACPAPVLLALGRGCSPRAPSLRGCSCSRRMLHAAARTQSVCPMPRASCRPMAYGPRADVPPRAAGTNGTRGTAAAACVPPAQAGVGGRRPPRARAPLASVRKRGVPTGNDKGGGCGERKERKAQEEERVGSTRGSRWQAATVATTTQTTCAAVTTRHPFRRH